MVGSSVNFTWSFFGDAMRVYWGLKKDGVNGFENSGILVSLYRGGSGYVTAPSAYSGRVSGSGDVSSGQVIFTLSLIRQSDQRFYGCMIYPYYSFSRRVFDSVYLEVEVRQLKVELEKGKTYEFVVTATNEFGESRKEDGKIQRIKTLAPPTIYKKSKSEVVVVEGNILFLVCQAEGSPTPHVSWRKNGKVLQSSINKTDFIIDDASIEDAGSYECEVSNSAGTVSHTVEVTVNGKRNVNSSGAPNGKFR
ncbi:hypothetical protein ACROYT_G027789 [Oculina patagonica]